MRAVVVVVLVGCGASPQTAIAPAGQLADGSMVVLSIAGERITGVARGNATTWLWPPIVDGHVHLALWPVADRLAARGVEAVVDLAAPEPTLGAASSIHVLAAGPMLTRPGGYPLDAWGSAGYGIGCADAACVTRTIDQLAARGAGVVKLALDDDGLDPALVAVAVAAAHAHHLKVAVHALGDASAAVAAAAGVDVLAHTPVELLADATVAAWRGRAVISTLAAFGGGAVAIDNLRRLRAAGAIVLYGTDLGNLRDDGPSRDELELLRRAGLDDAAITAAMTTTPIAYWGFDRGQPIEASPQGELTSARGNPIGDFRLAVGGEATLVVLDGDPRRDATLLLAPRAVYLRGHRMR